MVLLEHAIPHGPRPGTGQHVDVAREMADADLDAAQPLLELRALQPLAPEPAAADLVIDAARGRRPRDAEPVHADPGADLFGRPRVRVRPVVEFLVDPRQQRDGAVRESVAQRLRLGRLQQVVAEAFLVEPRGSVNALFLSRGQWAHRCFGGEQGILQERGFVSDVHVEVSCPAVLRVEHGDCTADVPAPVACSSCQYSVPLGELEG